MMILAIAIGGAIGCVLRFWLAKNLHQFLGQAFPYGILTVNVIGSLVIGVLSVLFLDKFVLSAAWRAGILVGLLGGFTTFSSFTLDVLELWLKGSYWLGGIYVILSVVLSLGACGLGIFIGRSFI